MSVTQVLSSVTVNQVCVIDTGDSKCCPVIYVCYPGSKQCHSQPGVCYRHW